jgi:aspartyl protease family protein
MSNRETRSLGKGMMIGAWVLLLLLLTLFFGGVLEKRNNPNRDPSGRISGQGVREVVLERNVQGHYVASGFINGYPVTFLVDTGATQVAISEKLADRLGLEKQGGTFSQTANGVVAVWQTQLERVTLGVIEQHNVRAAILPDLKPWNQVLLGMSFLKQLELVQRDGTLLLRQLPSSAISRK